MDRFPIVCVMCIALLSERGEAAGPVAVPPAPSGSVIRYELPSTTVRVSVGMTLTKCVNGFSAKPEVAFTASAGPTQHAEWRFQMDGRRLQSFWKSKKLSLETFPDGSIKSLNGGLSDQTGAIIGSVIKIAATALALAPNGSAASLAGRCGPDAVAALNRVDAMSARVKLLRAQLATATPSSMEGLTKTIDALAAEIARLRTNELRVDLSKEIVVERGIAGAVINWKSSDFAKWLPKGTPEFPVTDVSVGLCFREAPQTEDAAKLACDRSQLSSAKQVADEVAPVSCPDDADCSVTIVLREPRKAMVQAFAMGSGFDGVPDDKPLKQGEFMAAQWGDIAFLPLTVGFGKSVNFAMGFDEYGHKVSQTWDTAARGTSILGTASAAADSLAGIYRTAAGAEVAGMKAETDAINARKALNQARFCSAVYEAGGFDCP